jgi:endonuclease-3 related protein
LTFARGAFACENSAVKKLLARCAARDVLRDATFKRKIFFSARDSLVDCKRKSDDRRREGIDDERAARSLRKAVREVRAAAMVAGADEVRGPRLENVREAGVLDPHRLHQLPVEELAELIRPAGYYRVKAQRLRNLLKLVVEQYDGDLEAMFSGPPDLLREELLAVRGVGPETADAILLYAGEKPAFVVDTYAQRVLARHGWIDFDADYHMIQEHIVSELPSDVRLYNEYHALLVRVGKDHCKTAPKCEGCPLQELLPDGGPRTPEW